VLRTGEQMLQDSPPLVPDCVVFRIQVEDLRGQFQCGFREVIGLHLPCEAVDQGFVLVNLLELFLLRLFGSVLTTQNAWYAMLVVVSSGQNALSRALTLMLT